MSGFFPAEKTAGVARIRVFYTCFTRQPVVSAKLGELAAMSTSAVIAGNAREKAQTEIEGFDIRIAVVGTVWLAFYAIALFQAITDQAFAAVIELSMLH